MADLNLVLNPRATFILDKEMIVRIEEVKEDELLKKIVLMKEDELVKKYETVQERIIFMASFMSFYQLVIECRCVLRFRVLCVMRAM